MKNQTAYLFRVEQLYEPIYILVYAENEEQARETAKRDCKEVKAKSRRKNTVAYWELKLMTFKTEPD